MFQKALLKKSIYKRMYLLNKSLTKNVMWKIVANYAKNNNAAAQ